jgi:hypothetical protein
VRPYLSDQIRTAVVLRARGQCEYCHHLASHSSDPFEVEHIIPIDKGGSSDLENLALACRGCNGLKGTRTEAHDPLTGEVVSLFHPRSGDWSTHFVWSHDFRQMIGKTPTGRATIALLELNRIGLQNLRRALQLDGFHPPED